MTANKHTRGPWVVLPEEVDRDYIRVRGTQLGMRYKIANVPTPPQGIERDACETRANARLIAAAPELLEFIQHAADQLESGIQEYTGSPEEPPQPASKWDYDAGQLVGELRRLIAKATGGAA